MPRAYVNLHNLSKYERTGSYHIASDERLYLQTLFDDQRGDNIASPIIESTLRPERMLEGVVRLNINEADVVLIIFEEVFAYLIEHKNVSSRYIPAVR